MNRQNLSTAATVAVGQNADRDGRSTDAIPPDVCRGSTATRARCRQTASHAVQLARVPNRLLGVSVPINTLANVLSGRVSRTVVDETARSGVFD